MFGLFTWIRKGVKAAFIGGIEDALADLERLRDVRRTGDGLTLDYADLTEPAALPGTRKASA